MVAGGVNGDVRCLGRGDLIPRGGGRRLAGGVEDSSKRMTLRESSRRSVGCGIGRASSETGARVG
jgi:hypothetical protein